MTLYFEKAMMRAVGAVIAISAIAPVQAAQVLVTPDSTVWQSPLSENKGAGSSTITETMARAGKGALEMTGDRTRMVMGSLYGGTNLGLFDSLTQLTFDWAIHSSSVAQLHADYTPALRVTVIDKGLRSELIWEGAYNGTYGQTNRDTWYSSGANDVFHRYEASTRSTTLSGNSQVNLSLAKWQASSYFSDAAYIAGFSVGVGGSAGNGYRAFADNVTVGLNGINNTYNFETSADVPEPGSLALLGLGVIGAAIARRKKRDA